MDNLFGEEPKTEKKKIRKKPNEEHGKKQQEPKSFESALEELENLIDLLDRGDTALEESVALFEHAQFLAKWCQDKLDRIEGKLKLLISDGQGGFDVRQIDEHND